MSLGKGAAVLLGRTSKKLLKLVRPAGGSALPGLIVSKIFPKFLAKSLSQFQGGIIAISGSAGKSTTTKLVVGILEAHGVNVFTNPSTANIEQGLTTSVIDQASLGGKISADVAVLEFDEGHGARLAPQLDFKVFTALNVVIDQVDRFDRPDDVITMMKKMALRSDHLVVNANDASLQPVIDALRPDFPVTRFGFAEGVIESGVLGYLDERDSENLDLTVTKVDGAELEIAGLSPKTLRFKAPAKGLHYTVDTVAAIATAAAYLGENFDLEITTQALENVKPVFARSEQVVIRDQKVEFYLVQNPSSLALNINTLPDNSNLMYIVGSDVRDYSYWWSVDLSPMKRATIVSGSKAHDAALHLLYSGVPVENIELDVPTAVEKFLQLPVMEDKPKVIVFSADGMRRTRRHLGLTQKDGLDVE